MIQLLILKHCSKFEFDTTAFKLLERSYQAFLAVETDMYEQNVLQDL